MSGSVSPLELTWTGVAGIGLLFSVLLVVAGLADFVTLRAAIRAVPPRAYTWGPRWWHVVGHVGANAGWCLFWVLFIVIGFVAMTWPPPPPSSEQAARGQWLAWLLILAEFIGGSIQVWNVFIRNRVEHAIPFNDSISKVVQP